MAPDAAPDRRWQAANRCRPSSIRLLLVAEGPPADLHRYFYFEDVPEHDSLFRYVARELLGDEPTRTRKSELLRRLEEKGVFLIDVSPEPIAEGDSLLPLVPDLVERCRGLAPRRIILIKATVYDAAYSALATAGLPVVDERIPFPGSGQQKKFQSAFRSALTKI